ncbi:hypothetical protein ABVT39_008672 [Epinephelus coioides]
MRKMKDLPPRRAAASAFSRLKPVIYKTNDGKVIVEDELLNFLVVKMRTFSHDAIVLLVTNVSTLLGRMEQLNSEICCMKRTLETQSNVCESLREVTAAIDGRLTAVEQPLPSASGPVASERISDATVQRETTALTPTVAARSSSQTQSSAWTTVVKKVGRIKPAPGNSAVQLRTHLGKTSARLERKKTGIIGTGTAGDIKSRFSSFCVTAECNNVAEMYDPHLWPAGSFVRRYFEPRQPRGAGGGQLDWREIHAPSYLRYSLWIVLGSPYQLSAS